MDEARCTNLEPVEPARLECRHHSAGEAHATSLQSRGVELRASDGRLIRLVESAIHYLEMRSSDEYRKWIGASEKKVGETRGIVSDNEWVLGGWSPSLVRRRKARVQPERL